MSEDDRAAKAARAKAMLKKRQLKKSPGPAAGVSSPNSPQSRPLSPALSQHPEEGTNEFGELVSSISGASYKAPTAPSPDNQQGVQRYADTRLISPPRHPPRTVSPTLGNGQDAATLAENQREIISLLVTEKTQLSESLQNFENVESKLQSTERRLEEELRRCKELQEELQREKDDKKLHASQAENLTVVNSELRDKLSEQERDLQITRANVEDIRMQLDARERRTRELEEQIQNDDRIERLERSLQNTQDRADELEFQLSKLRQVHSKTKSERDELEANLRIHAERDSTWKEKIATVEQELDSLRHNAESLTGERDSLISFKSKLESQVHSHQKTLEGAQQQLMQVLAELAGKSRQLDLMNADLRNAVRRAEDAEKRQQELQGEGSGLLHSLEEMRSKTLELTDAKLELTEKADSFAQELRHRDSTISELEMKLKELANTAENSSRTLQEIEARRDMDQQAADKELAELQSAYADLQSRLDDAVASVREMESERMHARQSIVRQQEETDGLRTSLVDRSTEIAALKGQLEEVARALDEDQALLRDVQAEVEVTRAEMALKDEEISKLRESGTTPTSPNSQSLGGEMMSALRQQHELELSASQSQIRNLQSIVFEAEGRIHTLQKQVSELEDELAQIRLQRPTKTHYDHRNLNQTEELRRPSFTSQRSGGTPIPPSPLTEIDRSLPPSTRHQRRVSLGMLKARMHSEMEAFSVLKASHSSSRAMSPSGFGKASLPLATLHEPAEAVVDAEHIRPHFLDESHVFWCSSCKGDLIVL